MEASSDTIFSTPGCQPILLARRFSSAFAVGSASDLRVRQLGALAGLSVQQLSRRHPQVRRPKRAAFSRRQLVRRPVLVAQMLVRRVVVGELLLRRVPL